MHSTIFHSGYGYSKIICEDVTSWFLNEYFPRHKIDVDIIHKGLKRDCVVVYCDVIGGYYRPRHFMIELQAHMDKEMYIKTLFHNLYFLIIFKYTEYILLIPPLFDIFFHYFK